MSTNDDQNQRDVTFLVLSGSMRAGSLNTKLARLAAATIEANGGHVDFASMAEFHMPAYNGDDEDESSIPAGAEELRRCMEATDAFILASPEYNGSMAGVVKNAVDRVSRFRPQPFHGPSRAVGVSVAVDGRRQPRTLVAARSARASRCARLRRHVLPRSSP